MSKKILSSIFTLALISYAGLINAIPIGGPGGDCSINGTCQGATYTLDYSGEPLSTTATTETFRISYRIDTSTLFDFGAVAIDTVGIKVTGSGLVGASLFAYPGGVWETALTTVNANGCSVGGGGWVCSHTDTNGEAAIGGLLEWIFDVEVLTGTLFPAESIASIKARYVDANGNKVGDLVSEGIPLQVPAPAILGIMGIGLMGIVFSSGLRRCKIS